MLFLQRTGRVSYQILKIVNDRIVVIDHFTDDRGFPSVKLIDECGRNMGYSGRNDMIADCEPLTGNIF